MEEHIRRMRTLYANRQAALVEAIEKYLGNFLDAEPRDAGLHLIGWLPPGVDDQEASRVLAELDLFAPPLSFYTHSSIDRGGLLLGYGGVPTEDIPEKVTQMASALGDRFGFNLS
jgi:GntR family transcriptional regulator/MocR family aminotransferase